MRYLKIFAQDVFDNDIPDVVYLEFYDDSQAPALVHRATAFDITENGKFDWVIADDLNQDGIVDAVDREMALEFAQLFLAFEWFSLDEPFDKYLKVFAGDFDNNGIPDTVRLHFHQGEGAPRDETIVYSAAVYSDGNGRGALSRSTRTSTMMGKSTVRIRNWSNSSLRCSSSLPGSTASTAE